MSSNLSLILCAVAALFAANFPPGQRRAALAVWAALFVNWLLCAWTYDPAYSPYALLGLKGTLVWMTADALFGSFVILTAFDRAWGWQLWTTAVVQVFVHFPHAFGMVWSAYLPTLDLLFLIQVAIFVAGGGEGVADLLHSGVVRMRGLRRPPRQAHAFVEEQAP